MHPFLRPLLPIASTYFSFSLTFSLLSPFSSATKGGFVARRGSTKPYTHPSPPLPTPRRAFRSVINACVHVRFVNDVTPFRGRHCRAAADFVFRRFCVIDPLASRRATRKTKGKRRFKGERTYNLIPLPPDFPIASILLLRFLNACNLPK